MEMKEYLILQCQDSTNAKKIDSTEEDGWDWGSYSSADKRKKITMSPRWWHDGVKHGDHMTGHVINFKAIFLFKEKNSFVNIILWVIKENNNTQVCLYIFLLIFLNMYELPPLYEHTPLDSKH